MHEANGGKKKSLPERGKLPAVQREKPELRALGANCRSSGAVTRQRLNSRRGWARGGR
jgi:hypothetical protein